MQVLRHLASAYLQSHIPCYLLTHCLLPTDSPPYQCQVAWQSPHFSHYLLPPRFAHKILSALLAKGQCLASVLRMGCPGGSMVKNPPENAGDSGPIPGSGRSLRRKWPPTPLFLPGKSHGQKSLAATVYWSLKELNMAEHACRHADP